ncbi:hypothetical protein AVV36_gp289 [Pectobacterium bacteriophage PM2]|uniref:Uncharacterized protein n=1 Tax=Pectobacterium bacteriophage PM2 TaxID=1429794 RepID=A0A0A0Q0H6_9CAUD|nr:hypothetical protein AVV36_gp289 [Pectobacterium bacteriophage PM2]AHY25121.1 hypothetical protein PM2_159 [Pectobacterium bacteriophage PM2]
MSIAIFSSNTMYPETDNNSFVCHVANLDQAEKVFDSLGYKYKSAVDIKTRKTLLREKAYDKFYVFAGDNYYPSGGFNDFLSKHPNIIAARQAVLEYLKSEGEYSSGLWWHIYDINSNKIVERS